MSSESSTTTTSTSLTHPKIEKITNAVSQQKYAVILFSHTNNKIDYICVPRVTRTREFAVKCANDIAQKIGIQNYPICIQIVQVGWWNSINTNFKELTTSYNPEEANTELNNFMKAYLTELDTEAKVQKERKEKALDAVAEKNEGKVVTGKYYDPNTGIEQDKLNSVIEKDRDDATISENERKKEEVSAETMCDEESEFINNSSSSSEPEKQEVVNYLSVDKLVEVPIKEAKFFAVQFLTVESFPVDCREKYAEQKYFGLKIRGFYENIDNAKEHAENFSKKDKNHDTTVCPVCEWGTFGYDINTVKTEEGIVYQEKPLNEFMQVVHEKEVQERKKEEIKQADQEEEGTDENEEYENAVRNKLAMQQEVDKDVEKKTPDEILEEKLADVKRKKEESKRKMDEYEKSKKELEGKLNEIEGLFEALNNE